MYRELLEDVERLTMTIFSESIAKYMERYKHLDIPEGNYTIGAFVSAVMAIDDMVEAKEFWDGYLAHQTNTESDLDPAEVCRSNIGWCFGEGMSDDHKQMWINVSNASHPVFGTMTPTNEEAFQAGINHGT